MLCSFWVEKFGNSTLGNKLMNIFRKYSQCFKIGDLSIPHEIEEPGRMMNRLNYSLDGFSIRLERESKTHQPLSTWSHKLFMFLQPTCGLCTGFIQQRFKHTIDHHIAFVFHRLRLVSMRFVFLFFVSQGFQFRS